MLRETEEETGEDGGPADQKGGAEETSQGSGTVESRKGRFSGIKPG